MSDHNIKKLNDYQHVRLRTEMYFSSRDPHTQQIIAYNPTPVLTEMTWVPALYVAFREVLDNALDEVIGHKHGDKISVSFDPKTLECTIEDNGRGIPIAWDETHGCHLATLVMSEVRAGRNFGDRQGDTVGVNGIGASGVNFCSEYFHMEITRDGLVFNQQFAEDRFDNVDIIRGKPTTKPTKAKHTGTKITFKPSSKVFHNLTLPEEFIRSRMIEVATANPSVAFSYNGEKIKVKPKPEQTLFPHTKPVTIEINGQDVHGPLTSVFYVVPDWCSEGDHAHSIVNNIPAFNGGVHMDAFKRTFFTNLLAALEKESKKRKLSPNRADASEGVLIYNITRMVGPNFDAQSKTRLINDSVGNLIKKELDNPDLYTKIIKQEKAWIDSIYQRCADRTHKKDAAELAKMSKKLLKAKVPGLLQATGQDRSQCILFLAEGLCVDADTMVTTVVNGDITEIRAGDLSVGDVVITHQNNMKFVTATSSRVANGVQVTTKYGTNVMSEEHKLLVYSSNGGFEYLPIGMVDKNIHQLVRSKIVDSNGVVDIDANQAYPYGEYTRLISYGDNMQYCTDSHKYAVYDTIELGFRMLDARSIIPGRHMMMVKD